MSGSLSNGTPHVTGEESSDPEDQKSLYIDYQDVYRFDRDVADDPLEHPREIRPYFEDALELLDLPVPDLDFQDAHMRFYNPPRRLSWKSTKSPDTRTSDCCRTSRDRSRRYLRSNPVQWNSHSGVNMRHRRRDGSPANG